jgi:hypothetical protein
MTVYNEAEHWCEDRRGNVVIVIHQNLGWDPRKQGYVSRFLFEGRYYENIFQTLYERPDVCPQPEVRLGADIAFLDTLGLFYGDPMDFGNCPRGRRQAEKREGK